MERVVTVMKVVIFQLPTRDSATNLINVVGFADVQVGRYVMAALQVILVVFRV
jgi:hypothetical protein